MAKNTTNGPKKPIFRKNTSKNNLKKALLWGGLTVGAAASAFGLCGKSSDVEQQLTKNHSRIVMQDDRSSYAPNQCAFQSKEQESKTESNAEVPDYLLKKDTQSTFNNYFGSPFNQSLYPEITTFSNGQVDFSPKELGLLEKLEEDMDSSKSQAPPNGYEQHMPTSMAQQDAEKTPLSEYKNKSTTEWEKGEQNQGMMWNTSKIGEGKLTLSANSVLENRLTEYDDDTHLPQVVVAVDRNNDGVIENIDLNNDGKYDKEGEVKEIFVQEYKPGEKTTFDIGEPIELEPRFKDIDGDGEPENVNRLFAGYVVTSEIVNHDAETITKKSAWQASYDNSGSYATAKQVAKHLDVKDYNNAYENFMNQATGQFIDKYSATPTDEGLTLGDSEAHILAFKDKTLSEKEQFKELTNYFAGVNEHGADKNDFEESFSEYYEKNPEIAKNLASKLNVRQEQLPPADKIASALEKNLYPEHNGITPLDQAYHNIELMNNGSHQLGKQLDYIGTETYTQNGDSNKVIFGPTDKMQKYLASLQGGN